MHKSLRPFGKNRSKVKAKAETTEGRQVKGTHAVQCTTLHTSQHLSTQPHTCPGKNPLHACVTIQIPSWVLEGLAA